MTEQRVETQDAVFRIEFDAMGHCTICRMLDTGIARVQRLIDSDKAYPMTIYPGCEHVLVYRSSGLWTANL